MRQDAIDLRIGRQQRRNPGLFRPQRIVAVVIADDLDVGIFCQHRLVATLQLRRDRRTGKAAVDDHIAFAVQLFDHPFGQHGRNLVPVGTQRIGAGFGHHLIKADHHDARIAGPFDRRVERRIRGRVDQDRGRLLPDHVVQRIDLRLNRVLDVLDPQIDPTRQRPLGNRNLGHPDHLLPPVIAHEIVGNVDDIGCRALGIGRSRGQRRGQKGSCCRKGSCATKKRLQSHLMVFLPLVHRREYDSFRFRGGFA